MKTTLERCGPFSLVVLSQRRSQVTPLSGHSDQNASETFSNKLQLNKVQSSLRQTSAKTTQVRSKAKTSSGYLQVKTNKTKKHRVGTPSIPSQERTTPQEPIFNTPSCSSPKLPQNKLRAMVTLSSRPI